MNEISVIDFVRIVSAIIGVSTGKTRIRRRRVCLFCKRKENRFGTIFHKYECAARVADHYLCNVFDPYPDGNFPVNVFIQDFHLLPILYAAGKCEVKPLFRHKRCRFCGKQRDENSVLTHAPQCAAGEPYRNILHNLKKETFRKHYNAMGGNV